VCVYGVYVCNVCSVCVQFGCVGVCGVYIRA